MQSGFSRESLMQRKLFLEDLKAKNLTRSRPQTISDWGGYLRNSIGCFRSFMDHTEVFKIDGGYIHVTSPYWPAVRNLDEDLFMNQLGYIKSPYRIYNEDAVTYYKVITSLKLLRHQLKAYQVSRGIAPLVPLSK